MKRIIITAIIIGWGLTGFTQENPDFLLWNSSHKLTVDDFGIKKNNLNTGLSFAQFSIDYSVTGYDFLAKNFNKKVRNSIIKTASWIDTSQYVDVSLRYQQTLFDMAEIYARKFRKQLKENKKQLIKGMSVVEELNSGNLSEFTKRRLLYETETSYGTDDENQLKWEEQIKRELWELSEFEYDR